ncbi:hypothetical protein [Oceanobacillus sp. FSL H7-0719]|uniref:hypothetical protein n=1 Tax=Oceanobacillus sp. FSL H7-0719 TaxID=2954507 RepID=UPI003254CA42
MTDNLTVLHALVNNNKGFITDIARKYSSSEEEIDPKKGKPELIDDLLPLLPESEKIKIIDETFNTPKMRYNAHVGFIKKEVPTEEDINEGCEKFNNTSDYNSEVPEYQTNYKQTISLIKYGESELMLYYTLFTKKPEYDFESMESKTIVFSNKVRVIIKPRQKIVTVFTGNKDIFNNVLSALTIAFNFPVLPLNANKTGISEVTRGSFSFHTIKFLDFIYYGLADIGEIGDINQISLETSSKSKDPQKVNVKGGNDLLDDKSICEYLFLYARDLVGVRLSLNIETENNRYKANIEISVRDNKVKIGVQKENHTIIRVQETYQMIENNVFKHLKKPGLIDEDKTIKLLDKIKQRAL